MIKLLCSTILIFVCSNLSAQKYYDALVVKKSNDTIRGRIMLFRGVMDGLIGIKEAYYYGGSITLANEKGKSIAHIRPKDVQDLYISYSSDIQQHWISNGKSLRMIYYEGKKIKWFQYYQTMIDGTPIQYDLLVNANNQSYTLNRLDFRRGLLKLTADKPQLAEEIKQLDFDFSRFLQLIQKYEDL